MSDTPKSSDGGSQSAGYEKRDAQPGKILFVGGLLTLGTLGAVFVSDWFDRALRSDAPASDAHPLAAADLPPQPRLQVRPADELEGHLAQEEALLNTYAWVDPAGGIARVPVDVAMDVMLDKGFPIRTESAGGSEQ